MGGEPTLLTVDCGTQSTRGFIFSSQGELLAQAQEVYNPHLSPQPGWAEQDPNLYWEGMVRVIARLKEDSPRAFSALIGMGITTQRATMINVDEGGKVLRPAIVWLDQRRAEPGFASAGGKCLRWLVERGGVGRRLIQVQAQGKSNWIRQNQPEIWAKTHKYLQVSGFLNHCLTGEFADSIASQIGHIPFDYKKQTWAGPGALPHWLFPIPRAKLPHLVAPGQILGRVIPRVARKMGLPGGLPVVACGSDKGCETLGSGVLDSSRISLSFGTTATVQTNTKHYFEALPMMPPYPSPVPGHYSPEVEIFRGFWMISWFKAEFAHPEVVRARAEGIAPETLLDDCLHRTPPGALGLVTHPYWGPGLDYPNARGSMVGFGAGHTRDHVYRSFIEGLGFGLREGMERIMAKGGLAPVEAAVSGGASQSDPICQIMADILNLPMVRGRTHETSGLGAAILTAVGTGVFRDLSGAVAAMVSSSRIFYPRPENRGIYDALYHRVYGKLAPSLGKIHEDIGAVLGA